MTIETITGKKLKPSIRDNGRFNKTKNARNHVSETLHLTDR